MCQQRSEQHRQPQTVAQHLCLTPLLLCCFIAATPALAARSLNSAFPGLINDHVDKVKGAIEHMKSKHHQQPAVIAPNYLITQQPQYVVAAMPQYVPPPTIIAGNPTPTPPPPPPPATVEEKEVTVRGSTKPCCEQQLQHLAAGPAATVLVQTHYPCQKFFFVSLQTATRGLSLHVCAMYQAMPCCTLKAQHIPQTNNCCLLPQILTPKFKPVLVPLPLPVHPKLVKVGAGLTAGKLIKAVAKAVIENSDTGFVIEEEEEQDTAAPAPEPMQPAPVPSAPADTVFVPTPVPVPTPMPTPMPVRTAPGFMHTEHSMYVC
jgi:hypothetical protein